MIIILNILSILFGCGAAYLWFRSALVPIPQITSIKSTKPVIVGALTFNFKDYKKEMEDILMGENPLENISIGYKFPWEMANLVLALRRQSKLSGYAAICTGIAVLLQLIAYYPALKEMIWQFVKAMPHN